MPIIISLFLPAGGSGKSTSTVNIASYLSTRFKVLVIDLDGGQSTTTNALISEIPSATAFELLKKTASMNETATPVSKHFPSGLRLVPGSPLVANFEGEAALDRNYWLADQFEGADFDFVLIDCAPASGVTTLMALAASTHVITPVATEPKCFEQLPGWERMFATIQKRLNPNLQWLGLLPCRYDARNRLDSEVLQALKDRHPNLVLPPIRSSVRFRESLAQGHPPWRQPHDDYLTATNHILRRLKYEYEILETDCIPKAKP